MSLLHTRVLRYYLIYLCEVGVFFLVITTVYIKNSNSLSK